MRTLGFVLFVVITLSYAGPCAFPEGTYSNSESASTIKAHMAFLADDLLEGREAGTRGEKISGLYIASAFEGIGLQPGGDEGSYVQNVPLRAATVDMESTVLEVETVRRHIKWLRLDLTP